MVPINSLETSPEGIQRAEDFAEGNPLKDASVIGLAYSAVLNASSDAVVIANSHGRVIEFNRAAEKMFGYHRSEVMGMLMGDAIVAPPLRDRFSDVFPGTISPGDAATPRDFSIESLAAKRDGTEFHVRVSVSAIQSSSEVLFVGFIRDISRERILTEELDAARMEWEQCFNAIPDNISILDTSGRILRANASMERVFGEKYGDLKGLDYRLLYCGTANPDPPPPCAAALNSAVPVHVEVELTAIPGKSSGWYAVSAYPLFDRNNVQWGVVSVVHDATARRRLQIEQDLFFKSSFDMLCVIGADGCFRLVSSSFQQFLGLSNEELVGRSVFELLHEDDRQAFSDQLLTQYPATALVKLQTRLTRYDGTERWLSWHLSKADTTQGIICGVARDVTEQLKGEAKMIKAREIAEESSKAKSEFLAVVSHEMRTPLHNILGSLDIVRSSGIAPHCRELIDSCLDSAEQLQALISDVLDSSRVEAGKLILDEAAFNLHELFLKVMPQFRKRAQEKHISLDWTFAPDTPVWVVGDAGKLRQIVTNLLTNAFKFTEAGFIHLEISVDSVQDSRATLHIVVADSGIGIPENRKTDIFKLFEQIDSSGTRKFGGVGLGLAICSRLVELMDGQIRVDSTLGVGSDFHVTCKLGLISDKENSPGREIQGTTAAKPVHQRQHILVVEDDVVGARLSRTMLESEGYLATVISNGRQLLNALHSMPPRSVDAIIMDIMMPEMGGFEATRAIRGSHLWFAGIPIIATTANAMSEDAVTCLSHGMDGYLSKPFSRRHLIEMVSAHLSYARQDAPMPDPEKLIEFSLRWDDLRESCNDDWQQIKEVAEIVEKTIPLQIGGINAAIQANDLDKLALSLHRLKGCLCHICTGPILDKISALEELVRNPRGLARIAFQMAAIERTSFHVIKNVRDRIPQSETELSTRSPES